MTSASRSRDCHVQTKRNILILLSAIKHDSTCISLGLPFSLACSNCGPTLDPLSMNRKVRQKKRGIKVNDAGVSSIGILLGHKGKMQQKVIH